MIIGRIAGIAFLPISILLFLNAWGITNVQKIIGISVMLIASIGIIATEIGDIIDTHMEDSSVILMWVIGVILMFPAILYFISLFATLPAKLLSSLPLITASFLFVEGLSSFFIGD